MFEGTAFLVYAQQPLLEMRRMDVEAIQSVDERPRDDLPESRQMQLCRKAHKRINLKIPAANKLY